MMLISSAYKEMPHFVEDLDNRLF